MTYDSVLGPGSPQLLFMAASNLPQLEHAKFFTATMVDWVQIILFLAADILASMQVYKLIGVHRQQLHNTVQLTGGKKRSFLILLLFIANLSRALSVAALLHFGNTVSEWTATFIATVPTLLFLSSYSVVILFWSQVYYAAILVTVPLLRVTFLFLSVAVYFLYAVTAMVSYWMKNPATFKEDVQILFGAAYSVVAFGIAYYGLKVAGQLSDRSHSLSRKTGILRRVVTLASICPVIFIVRALYSFAIGFHLRNPYVSSTLPSSVWDALANIVSDFLPSLLILTTFWNRKPPHVAPRAETTAPLLQHNYAAGVYLPQPGSPANQDIFIPRAVDQPLFVYPGYMRT